jgi:hypothetical protein
MPIEIKELHIRVTINVPSDGNPGSAEKQEPGLNASNREELVAACVEQVMQILKDKHER